MILEQPKDFPAIGFSYGMEDNINIDHGLILVDTYESVNLYNKTLMVLFV